MFLFHSNAHQGDVSPPDRRRLERRWVSSRHDVDPNTPPSSPTGQEGGVVLTLVVAVAVTLSRHAGALLSGDAAQTDQVLAVLLDALLTVPVVGVAVWLAGRTAALLGLTTRRSTASVSTAALLSLYFVPLFAPLVALLPTVHQLAGVAGGDGHAAHELTGLNAAGLANHGLQNAVAAQPAVLVAALVTLLVVTTPERFALPMLAGPRRPLPGVAAMASVPVLVAGIFLVPAGFTAASASADVEPAAHVGGCGGSGVTTRTYDVAAINVDITLNRFGDHDPFGFMYVLADKLDDVRAQEAALQANAAVG